ncbi:F0F1 ATP synthase subunit B' [Methylocella sp.]|uniref:F0F1 ATP synthase subunit B family protein n=1 Tax=Methylocella sp. TaxID=1978226 RepID=UPI0037850277
MPVDIDHGAHAFPPFDPSHYPSTLFWLLVTFGLLYLVMSKFALPRVETILRERDEKISGDLKEAHLAREKAAAADAEHERKIAEARGKAQALAQQTQARIAAESDGKRHALEADLAGKLDAAEKRILETKAGAMQNVESIAVDAAAAIVEHLTGRPADTGAIAAALKA